MGTMSELLREGLGQADATAQLLKGYAMQPVAGLGGLGRVGIDLLRGKGIDKSMQAGADTVENIEGWGGGPFTQRGGERLGQLGGMVERGTEAVGNALGNPIDKLGEVPIVGPGLAAGALGFVEAAPGPGKAKRAAKAATKAIDKAQVTGKTVREVMAEMEAAGEADVGRSLKGTKKQGDIVPQAELDTALANRAKYRSEPNVLPKKATEMSDQEWADWGAQYGADFSQQPMQSLGVSDLKTKQEIMVPGGLEGKFTIPELFQIKANNFDPAALGTEKHNALMQKFLRTYERPQGSDAVDIFNDLNFSLLSPNAPLTQNEFLAQRMRARTPEDLAAIAARRGEEGLSATLDAETGTGAASRGGLGVKGTADLKHQAALADLLRQKPEMFRPQGDETLRDVGYRVMNQVPGLSVKTASLGIPWTDLNKANTSAVDLHMIRHGYPRLKAENPEFAQRLADLTAKNPSLSELDAAINIIGGGHPEAVYRSKKTGELHPDLPEYMQPDKLAFEPDKWSRPNDYYNAVMGYIDESRGANPPHELFPEQWRKWDVYRGRVEPHEMAHPDWRKLPKMSFNELQGSLDAHKASGYMAQPGPGLYPDDVAVQPVPKKADWRGMVYGKATPEMLGATAAVTGGGMALVNALREKDEEKKK